MRAKLIMARKAELAFHAGAFGVLANDPVARDNIFYRLAHFHYRTGVLMSDGVPIRHCHGSMEDMHIRSTNTDRIDLYLDISIVYQDRNWFIDHLEIYALIGIFFYGFHIEMFLIEINNR